jgi:GTPase SAR1 family protein
VVKRSIEVLYQTFINQRHWPSLYIQSISIFVITHSKASFRKLEEWLDELRYYSHPAIKVFVIGNKADLEDRREVTYEEGETFRNEYNLDGFFETSAKTGLNTNELFCEAAGLLYLEYRKAEASNFKSTESTGTTNSFKLRQRATLGSTPQEEDNAKARNNNFCAC